MATVIATQTVSLVSGAANCTIAKGTIIGIACTDDLVTLFCSSPPNDGITIPSICGKDDVLAVLTILRVERAEAVLAVRNMVNISAIVIVEVGGVVLFVRKKRVRLGRKADFASEGPKVYFANFSSPLVRRNLFVANVIAIHRLSKPHALEAIAAADTIETPKTIAAIAAVLQKTAAVNAITVETVITKFRVAYASTKDQIGRI